MLPRSPLRVPFAALPGCAALVLALLALGCESTLDPLAEQQEAFFAVYGFVDTDADTQFVRVTPLRGELTPPGEPPPPPTVTGTQDGAAVAWRDSLVQLDDGTQAYLFFTTTSVRPGLPYRLEVTRADGARTTVTTEVPPVPAVQVADTFHTPKRYAHYLTWTLPRAPQDATVFYRVAPDDGAPPVEIPFTYDQQGTYLEEDGVWRVLVELKLDQPVVRERALLAPQQRALFYGVRMTITVENDAWLRPQDVAVEHGHGFFGAVARFTFDWSMPTAVLDSLHYTDRQPAR